MRQEALIYNLVGWLFGKLAMEIEDRLGFRATATSSISAVPEIFGRYTDAAEALHLSIHLSPIASVISNPRLPENPIIDVNQAFCDLTGYSEDEIIGRNCRFLAGPATEPWLTERIRDGIRQKRAVLVEILNYKRDGTPFRNAVLVAPIFGVAGSLDYFLGSQVELAEDSIGPSSSRHQAAAQQIKTLSKRQLEILAEMAAGFRSKEIAEHLSLSEKTVHMHRALILRKLHKTNVADAVRIAVEAGL